MELVTIFFLSWMGRKEKALSWIPFSAMNWTNTSAGLCHQLPQLPSGKHQIQIKACTSETNSNTAVLNFSVENKEQLKIAQVRNFPNPFRALGGKTILSIEHNQPNSDLLVKIDIVDAVGNCYQIHRTLNTEGTPKYWSSLGWHYSAGQKNAHLASITIGFLFLLLAIQFLGSVKAAGQILVLWVLGFSGYLRSQSSTF